MKILKQKTILLFLSVLFFESPVIAGTDLDAQESFLKAKVANHQQEMDHASHANHVDENKKFRGVFYGFLPCSDCNGIKMTLSLKDNNNYLLVYQQARESTREFYEKGKYVWDDEASTVTLTPRDGKADIRQFAIKDEGSLVQFKDGKRVTGELAERYTLRRSDTVKSREVHIH